MREQKSKNRRRNTMKLQILTVAGALALAAAPPFGQALAQAAGTSTAAPKFITQQPVNEWLARVFIGQAVHNAAGETVGDIKDLVFNRKGQISTVVIGVGGFLSMGEKNVGIPFDALTFNAGKNGERVIVVALSKDALVKAPVFKATEKTTFDKVKDKASDLSHNAVDKAVDLKDQAAQKIREMKGEPTK
jgi:sporulation protein YlmC with PRC-barrel domain